MPLQELLKPCTGFFYVPEEQKPLKTMQVIAQALNVKIDDLIS